MPTFATPGEITPGQFGPTSVVPRPTRYECDHVLHRDALGDAHDEVDAGVGRLEDRLGREPRRHEDHRRVGARFPDRVGDGVEHRDALDVLPPLPGVTPPTTFVP